MRGLSLFGQNCETKWITNEFDCKPFHPFFWFPQSWMTCWYLVIKSERERDIPEAASKSQFHIVSCELPTRPQCLEFRAPNGVVSLCFIGRGFAMYMFWLDVGGRKKAMQPDLASWWRLADKAMRKLMLRRKEGRRECIYILNVFWVAQWDKWCFYHAKTGMKHHDQEWIRDMESNVT